MSRSMSLYNTATMMDTLFEVPFSGLIAPNGFHCPRMVKISNITNSSDPQMINSRIFVGNVNTFALSKDDVETVFKRYGKIIGISMHKGYAFIQYTNDAESRNAVAGEDQRMYAGQQIDVNLAAEPKPNRPNRKRPQGAGADWDYYYNVPLFPGTLPLQVPMAKRPRPDLCPPPLAPIIPPAALTHIPQMNKRTLVQVGSNNFVSTLSPIGRKPPLLIPPRRRTTTDEADILICGVCKQTFSDIERLTAHKRTRCKLRFACRCNNNNENTVKSNKIDEPVVLTCATCQETFTSCWELCQHCQKDHQLNIYSSPSHDKLSRHDSIAGSYQVSDKMVSSPVSLDGSATETLLQARDQMHHENGLSSPGSGSLMSDVSSVDINEDGLLDKAPNASPALVTMATNGSTLALKINNP